MKILFITCAGGIDYMSDMVFHGLIGLGHTVTDSKYMWYMSDDITKEQKQSLYGNGFTISGTLHNRKDINRENIRDRILSHEYDIIVYGSIQRCHDYINEVISTYDRNKVIFIDGEDNLDIVTNLMQHGIMFKREQYSQICNPISFAIPREKLCNHDVVKTHDVATVKPNPYPGIKRFYMFTDESEYYNEYQHSRFGVTRKKGGWDCMRHYEIIGNKCIPFFENYDSKPPYIMTNWPSDLQHEANQMYESKNFSEYDDLLNRFFDYCKNNLTTEHLASYILKFTK